MGTQVASVIDRALRDFLQPPDDQPTRTVLTGALSASLAATSVTYDPDYLAAEEEDLLGPGTIVEVGRELCLVETVDVETSTITAMKRAVNGSTLAAHSSGDFLTIAPTWGRQMLFDAVADAVVRLWPDLYAVGSEALTVSASAYTEVPAAVEMPMYVWARPAGIDDWRPAGVQFLDHFPPSSTGKAVRVPGLAAGATGHLVYRRRFPRPTQESDDLTDAAGSFRLDESWLQLVIVAAVSYAVAGRDLDHATQEFLTDQLGAQGFPVGSGARVRDALLRYQEFLRREAKRQLRSRHRQPINTGGTFT